MADELHAVTRLLLKRMESHPEEFLRGANRWGGYVGDVIEWGSEADGAALNAALRDIRLGEVHEWVMDELLSGEQRRAEERRQTEEETKRLLQPALQVQNLAIQRLSDMQRDTQKVLNQQMQDVYGQSSWDQKLQNNRR